MISSYNTNQRRVFEDHLIYSEKNFQTKSFIIEQIAEKNNF